MSDTTLTAETALAGYHAALEGVALRDESAYGRLELRDRDRANLLQRLSSNNVEALRPGQGTRTVLTNHNGRIIDLLTVYALDDTVLALTSAPQRSAVYNLLRKNIFFNDKLKLADLSDTLAQLALYGPRAAATLAATGVSAAELPLHAIMSGEVAGVAVRVARTLPLGGAGFSVFVPRESLAAVRVAFEAAGATPLDDEGYDLLRVEAGYGSYGRELSLEYIPLETGLRDAISFNKGCYVGQEIIARMDSRNRLAKQLRGLRLNAPLAVEQTLKLEVAGKEAGDLTSAVVSPRHGAIALAYVRSAHAEPGTVVGIAGSAVTGTVVELPFG